MRLTAYNDFVARLIDQKLDHLQIIERVMEADLCGKVKIPTKKWITFDQLLKASLPIRDEALSRLSGRSPCCHLNETKTIFHLRYVLQSPSYAIDDPRRLPKWQAQVNKSLPLWNDLFGDKKRKALREFGILDKNDQWCETQFQRFLKISDKIRRQKLSITRSHFVLLVNDWATWKGDLKVSSVGFAYMIDSQDPKVIRDARKIAEFCLYHLGKDTSIGTEIEVQDVATLRTLFEWIFYEPAQNRPLFLFRLATIARECEDFNEKQFVKVLEFVANNGQKSPDPELLRDYVGGYVDAMGKGFFQ